MNLLRWIAVLPWVSAFGCKPYEVPDQNSSTPVETGVFATDTLDSSATATDAEESGAASRLDVGAEPGASGDDDGVDDTCRKLDVVMAVDNSGSMQEEIDALRGPVFDSLPQQLLAIGGGLEDFHLAVVDACPKPAFYHDSGGGGFCQFSSGSNWMISTSASLADEFACVTDLVPDGYMGQADECEDDGDLKDDDEQPALTASTSISPQAVANENAGFLREDAILFVVAITDEDEELLGTSVDEIAQSIIEAKGTVDNVVFLGIGGGSDCDGPYGSAIPADNLRAVTEVFSSAGRGIFWDLCQGDLESAFAAAIEFLDTACDEFVPVG